MKHGNYSYQPLAILTQKLKLLCQQKQNGMLFVITDSKTSAHISLHNGHIVDIAFSAHKGEEALALLSQVNQCRFQFSRSKDKKRPDTITLEGGNDEIFNKLSTHYYGQKNAGRQKILIVDDSKLVRKLVVQVLSSGYEVFEATNGLEAIASLAKNKPDLVLLDVIMPQMDGYKTLEIIKKNEQYASIPVFMLTSRDSLMDKLKGKMSKSDKYLTKPFSQVVLLDTVKNHFLNIQSNLYSLA